MILELAILDVKPGTQKAFEQAFSEAQEILKYMKGYRSHQLQHCIEDSHRYVLLVNWDTLEDHTLGFRRSAEYQRWRELLHHFYHPFPQVQHYSKLDSHSTL